jgi:hypothetical protein
VLSDIPKGIPSAVSKKLVPDESIKSGFKCPALEKTMHLHS